MMDEKKEGAGVRRTADRRGAGRLTAAIFVAGVAVLVGVVGYFVLSAATPAGASPTTAHSCEPASSPVCKGSGASNDASSLTRHALELSGR